MLREDEVDFYVNPPDVPTVNNADCINAVDDTASVSFDVTAGGNEDSGLSPELMDADAVQLEEPHSSAGAAKRKQGKPLRNTVHSGSST